MNTGITTDEKKANTRLNPSQPQQNNMVTGQQLPQTIIGTANGGNAFMDAIASGKKHDFATMIGALAQRNANRRQLSQERYDENARIFKQQNELKQQHYDFEHGVYNKDFNGMNKDVNTLNQWTNSLSDKRENPFMENGNIKTSDLNQTATQSLLSMLKNKEVTEDRQLELINQEGTNSNDRLLNMQQIRNARISKDGKNNIIDIINSEKNINGIKNMLAKDEKISRSDKQLFLKMLEKQGIEKQYNTSLIERMKKSQSYKNDKDITSDMLKHRYLGEQEFRKKYEGEYQRKRNKMIKKWTDKKINKFAITAKLKQMDSKWNSQVKNLMSDRTSLISNQISKEKEAIKKKEDFQNKLLKMREDRRKYAIENTDKLDTDLNDKWANNKERVSAFMNETDNGTGEAFTRGEITDNSSLLKYLYKHR